MRPCWGAVTSNISPNECVLRVDPRAEHVRPGGGCGVNAHLKVPCLVAGMAAGADSTDDMDVLRHGAMDALFGGVPAPSTLGSRLRSCTWGNVAQLEKAGRELRAGLVREALLLPGAGWPSSTSTRCRNGSMGI
jgi:hypothetical protein